MKMYCYNSHLQSPMQNAKRHVLEGLGGKIERIFQIVESTEKCYLPWLRILWRYKDV